jgi:kynureninase
VGCGYKYLNGGPGAPAFVWVAPAPCRALLATAGRLVGPCRAIRVHTRLPARPGITRYLCGTQPIISMAALECGLDTLLAAEPLGGMAALRAKSLALTDLFIELVETRCAGHGLTLATPRVHARRGSQVCLARGAGAYAIVQALIARNVIGDFRAGDGGLHPDILRFGFTPLYIGFEDVWHAVEHLRQVLDTGEWQRPEFNQKHAVT